MIIGLDSFFFVSIYIRFYPFEQKMVAFWSHGKTINFIGGLVPPWGRFIYHCK
jgi:hypothetical protein